VQVNNLREALYETGTDHPGKSKKCFPVYCASGQTSGRKEIKGHDTAYAGITLSINYSFRNGLQEMLEIFA
jgi:hypothetical protein